MGDQASIVYYLLPCCEEFLSGLSSVVCIITELVVIIEYRQHSIVLFDESHHFKAGFYVAYCACEGVEEAATVRYGFPDS